MTTVPPPVYPVGSFNKTIGALLLGNTFSFFFLGIVLTKAVDYFTRYRKDKYFITTAATVVIIGSMIESICYNVWSYEWSSNHYGDPSIMAIVPTSFTISLVNVGLVTCVNQHFYAWRLYHVGGNSWILPGCISFLAFYQLAFIIYLVPLIARNNSFLGLSKLIFPASYSWLASAAAGDLLITAGMVWYLVIKARTRITSVAGVSQNLILTIALRTIQFNALSLLTQSLEFVLFLTDTGLYFSLFTASLCKVYAFSLLISLTSRGGETQYDETLSFSIHTGGGTGFGGGTRSRQNNGLPNITSTTRSHNKYNGGGESTLFNPTTSGIVVTTMKNTKVDKNDEEWNEGMVNGYPVNVLLVAGQDDEKDSTNRIKFHNDRDVELDSYC